MNYFIFLLAAVLNCCAASKYRDCRPRKISDDMYDLYKIDKFYEKMATAWGRPIIASKRVHDRAVQWACLKVYGMLADRADTRALMESYGKKFAILGENEVITQIPEYSYLPSRYDERARGLGGTTKVPLTVSCEENLLCTPADRYNEDIYIHEAAHGVHLVGSGAIRNFKAAVRDAYRNAKKSSIWRNTYAITNYMEYFAEGVQSYFNTGDLGIEDSGPKKGNRNVNHIDNRYKLYFYDFQLFYLINRLFPCGNWFAKQCTRPETDYKYNCPIIPNLIDIDLEPGQYTVLDLSQNFWNTEVCLADNCGIGTPSYSTYIRMCPKTCLIKVDRDW